MRIRKNKKYFTTLTFLLLLTTVSALILSKNPNTDTTNAAGASILAGVTVDSVCTMSGSMDTNKEHVASVHGSSYTADIGETVIRTNCNDGNGYSVYAVGFTDDTEGTTTLVGNATNYTIPTGTSTSTNTSNWAMKLTSVSGTSAPSILSDTSGSYESYHSVPNTATKVVTRTSNTTSPSEFKTTYAVAVSGAQPADTYTGQVKYTLVHPNYAEADGTVPRYYMQDFTVSDCQALASDQAFIVYDRRDEKDYTVRYIGQACWMTQNLRITGIVYAEDSNFSTYDSVNLSEYSLDSNDETYANHCDSANGLNYVCSKNSGNKVNGVWYNYAAASANTITGDLTSTLATEDICPSGWRMPAYLDDPNPAYKINTLYSSKEKFTFVVNGVYSNGSITELDRSRWWTTQVYGGNKGILWGGDTGGLGGTLSAGYNGLNIRCARA
jgi:uncharacterized protein (TIGR02145 family)